GRPLIFRALDRAEGPGREHPLVQVLAAFAERVFRTLAGAGPIAVERDAEGGDADFGHDPLLDCPTAADGRALQEERGPRRSGLVSSHLEIATKRGGWPDLPYCI